MYTIRLATGAEYAVSWCGASDNVLNIQVLDQTITLLDVTQVFSDKTATNTIVFMFGEDEVTHENYTDLILVQDQRWQGGGVLVQLRKEAV